jgi:hypothetical protein
MVTTRIDLEPPSLESGEEVRYKAGLGGDLDSDRTGTADRLGQGFASLSDTFPANLPGPRVETPIDVGCFDEDKLSCHEFIILLG